MTDRAEIAVNNYVTRGIINAEKGYSWSQAMRDAGYKEGYIVKSSNTLRNKPEVNKAIENAKAKIMKRNDLAADDVIQELKKIGFANIIDYVNVDNKGEVKIKGFKGIDRESLAAVESVKLLKNGVKELKMASKLNALEQLGRHFGIYDKDNAQRSKPFVLVFERPTERRKRVDSETRA